MKYLNLKAFSSFLPVLATVFLSSCQKESAFDCVKSTGSITTETRLLPLFRTVRVFDNVNVTLIPDSAYWVEVKAGSNLINNIRTQVRQGELWIENINKCNWVRSYNKPLEVQLHTPSLGTIYHDGDGTFLSQGVVPADTLFIHLTGAGNLDLTLNSSYIWLDMYELGDIRLQGRNLELVGSILSFGSLYADQLSNRNAYLTLTGEGHARVKAEQEIGAVIEGNGNVYYHNIPRKLHREGKGQGQLLKAY